MQFFKTGDAAIAESAVALRDDWQMLGTSPSACASPADLPEQAHGWLPAMVPGTVAQALQVNTEWEVSQPRDFDGQDWWYVCSFSKPDVAPAEKHFLRFAGLATITEVWLNGALVLQSDNMFVEHVLEVTEQLQPQNTLHLCFRALQTELGKRRPRPQWKTKLVSHQQLRWIRTSLLGRIPGWSPPVAPVGPWREVLLESRQAYALDAIDLQTSLADDAGTLRFACSLRAPRDAARPVARLRLDQRDTELTVSEEEGGYRLQGELTIASPELWWPHTHGEPGLYACRLTIEISSETLELDCGDVGFRALQVDAGDDGFSLQVNHTPVFCRGACWTVNDIISLRGSDDSLEHSLQLACEAGMNMIRVGGTMLYESEQFYRLCDRLGIMVWQDFMFANMDYPIDDATFAASVSTEVTQQLQRLRTHPCISVYCGNSEVEQQAAMLGMPQEKWRSELFSGLIPDLCQRWHSDIPYVPSTPSGGTLPFHVGKGVTHYYGVGAYLRPVTEVRRANVRFTSECLGFSNVPEDKTLNELFEGQTPVCHHPLWKSRVPRDTGTGWDFEDVRDHYLKMLFAKDPVELRSFDMPQYLALSRITTGEVMAQVFAEWRSAYSQCGGGLVWFYKDLWQGAGWGILGSDNQPKACYRYLQRVWQPQTVILTDEGLDGVHAHVINEKADPLVCRLELQLLRGGRVVTARAEQALTVSPRSTVTLGSDALLQGFYDVGYYYRFGPPKHDVVIASLLDKEGHSLAEAFYFPGERQIAKQHQITLVAEATVLETGEYLLELESDTLLQAVHFDIKGYIASDEYFHLIPGQRRRIKLKKYDEVVKRFRCYVESLSLDEAVSIKVA
ncbi:MAG: glycoside hydrolase family 2 protein [Gammaproteobacteria bacterium]